MKPMGPGFFPRLVRILPLEVMAEDLRRIAPLVLEPLRLLCVLAVLAALTVLWVLTQGYPDSWSEIEPCMPLEQVVDRLGPPQEWQPFGYIWISPNVLGDCGLTLLFTEQGLVRGKTVGCRLDREPWLPVLLSTSVMDEACMACAGSFPDTPAREPQ